LEQRIYAAYDDDGVIVYQAYRPQIARAALAHGTFRDGFKLERMTWIKPSFGWMLYRSGYARKSGQEYVLRITISHEGFLEALENCALTGYEPDVHGSKAAHKQALADRVGRVQWDPDRDLRLRRLDRRAIQIGLKPPLVERYVRTWITRIEDATDLAHTVEAWARDGGEPPAVPEERVYPVPPHVVEDLGIDDGSPPL